MNFQFYSILVLGLFIVSESLKLNVFKRPFQIISVSVAVAASILSPAFAVDNIQYGIVDYTYYFWLSNE
jgi:hypothetical protein